MNIRERLFQTDPYLDFPVRESEVRGWNSEHPKLKEILHQIQPRNILEIGTWLGASAIFMARNSQAHLVCLDTWLGAQEMWENQADPERYGALRIEHGYPTIYRDFMSNVIREGFQDRITPMPLPSSIGLKLLESWKFRPDLIYVDGSHSFEDCREDVKLSMVLGPRIICGDDFHSWPEVGRAVSSWLPDVQVEESGFWWVDTRNRISSAAIE
jgi:hypothetical protein